MTLFSDGLTDPDGRTSRALRELTIALDQGKRSRLMAVMGYGGVRNVRDLLQSRGVDLAIFNNDIFAYLDLARAHPDARRKLRSVATLFSQRIYLAARDGLPSIEHLAGKKIAVLGPESTAGVTARALFGLSQVPVVVSRPEEKAPLDADAVLFLEDDAPRAFARLGAAQGQYRLVPLASTGALANVYHAASIGAAEAGGLTDRPEVPTLRLETLVAVFDWAQTAQRYTDVARFIDGFFLAVPTLRKQFPDSVWPALDLQATALGWKRYDYAERALAGLVKNQPAAASPATGAKPLATVATAAPPPARSPSELRLVMTAAPPLTDQKLPSGGVIGALANAVLREAFGSGGRSVMASWSKDRQALSAAMLEPSAGQFTGPWETPVCPPPENAGPHSVALCERALLSDPLFQMLYVLFLRPDSSFDLSTEEKAAGGVLCVPAGHELPPLGDRQKQWLAQKTFDIVRPATLIDCLGLMERREADALLVNEIEGRFALSRLGLGNTVRMAEMPVATRGIHIALAKTQPGAAAMIAEVNAALARLKKAGRYGEIVGRHIAELQGEGAN